MPVVRQLIEGGPEIAYALLSGDPALVENLSEENRLIAEFIVETVEEILDQMALMDDYQKGYILGLIAGEVAIDVTIGLATGGAALIAKGATVTRLLNRLESLPGIPASFHDRFARVATRIARIGALCAVSAQRAAAGAACKRCAAAYARRLLDAPGSTHFAAIDNVVRRLDQGHNLARPGLAAFIRGVMRQDIYNFPEGTVVLANLPTVRNLQNLFTGRGLGQFVHAHHLIERRFLEPVFSIPSANTLDIPGVGVFAREHINYGGENLHAITTLIRRELGHGIEHTGISPAAVIEKHKLVYRSPGVNWPGLADACQAWLDSLPIQGSP